MVINVASLNGGRGVGGEEVLAERLMEARLLF